MKKGELEEKNQNKAKHLDRNDEKYWILGIFYFNCVDPLMFVRGRGKGLVPNYGHKAIQILMAISAAIILTLIILMFLR